MLVMAGIARRTAFTKFTQRGRVHSRTEPYGSSYIPCPPMRTFALKNKGSKTMHELTVVFASNARRRVSFGTGEEVSDRATPTKRVRPQCQTPGSDPRVRIKEGRPRSRAPACLL